MIQPLPSIAAAVICCYSSVLAGFVSELLRKVFIRSSPKITALNQKLKACSDELSHISAIDDFASYARKKREINALNEQIKSENRNATGRNLVAHILLQSLVYVPAIVFTVFAVWFYFGVSLAELNSRWFFPLNWFLSFPATTSVTGTVGLSFSCFLLSLYYFVHVTTSAQ